MVVQYLCQDHMIVAPRFQNVRGYSVGFNSRFRRDLEELNQDCGAKQNIQKNNDKLKEIETEDFGVLADIDTQFDLDNVVNERL